MEKMAHRIAEFLRDQEHVTVVTHIDADGITSGAIASLALDRAGIQHEVVFIKQLEQSKVEELKEINGPIWFTDLGSAKLQDFNRTDILVTDHHIPPPNTIAKENRGDLLSFFSEVEQQQYHLNPHLFGFNGSTEISGAGLTYMVARHLSTSTHNNMDLSALAIVGAVGDLQDTAACRLMGLNRSLVADGIESGVIEAQQDLRFFGRETRPLQKLLQYSSDPIIPSISGNDIGAIEFLMELGIDLRIGDRFRRWIDLDRSDKKKVISGMVKLALTMGLEPADVERIVGEVYLLTHEETGTPMHDAKEFATLLNACGKNLQPEIGFRVCKGDRGEFLTRAYSLLEGHRRNLATLIHLVEENGIEKRDIIQFFQGGDDIPENIVGIIAGMLLNSGSSDLDKVMVGITNAEDGLKASARTTRNMVKNGINLAEAMKQASNKVGGEGGGHNIAAGAFIPGNDPMEFLDILEKLLKAQIQG